MKPLYESNLYMDEINEVSKTLNKAFIQGKSLLISGATGMICSYLIDALLVDKTYQGTIFALTTSLENAISRFCKWKDDSRLIFISHDIRQSLVFDKHIDFVIHGASYTDPKGYAEHPIDTMLINFNGVKHMLDVAVHHSARFLFMSSCEIYGEADVELIGENYSGYLNPLDVRSCYNESKRASETLCIAYAQEHNIEVVVPRFSRVFGPTMRMSDTKALSQFIKNAIRGEDILLKSQGTQTFSYCYVADSSRALLFLLENGKSKKAYNVANPEIFSLKEMAEMVAKFSNSKIIINFKDELQGRGYSKTTKAIQDSTQLTRLGYSFIFSINDAIKNTLNILQNASFL